MNFTPYSSPRPMDVAVEFLAERAHVGAENRDIERLALGMLRCGDRLFGGAHAADGGTIGVAAVGIAAPDTLDEGDSSLPGCHRKDAAGCRRSGPCREHALELHAGQDIGIAAVANSSQREAWNSSIAGSKNNAADLDIDLRRLLIVQNRSGRACFDALHAFAAQTAGQAALGFEHGLFQAESQIDFTQVLQLARQLRLEASGRDPAAEHPAWDCGRILRRIRAHVQRCEFCTASVLRILAAPRI